MKHREVIANSDAQQKESNVKREKEKERDHGDEGGRCGDGRRRGR